MQRLSLFILALVGASTSASAVTVPSESESPAALLERLYSYFGGVATFSVALSPESIFSGSSLILTINFRPSFFNSAGVGIGTLGVSAPNLLTAPDADTFSITIKGPPAGTLMFYTLVREDDNNDGVMNIDLGDDEWQGPELAIPAGATTTFNIPVSKFVNSGFGSGDGVQQFTSTPRMGLILDIHTKASYPGGLLTTPVQLLIDHVGFYAGPQSPPPSLVGDANSDCVVNFLDITTILSTWNSAGPIGDTDGDGAVNFADITTVLSNWSAACP